MNDSLQDALEAPSLLIAMPQVLDPFFYRSVVLLMAHGEDGSLGLVVNRPADLRIEEVLTDMEIPWSGDPEASAFVGGPVQPQFGSVLWSGDGPEGDTVTEIVPGLSLTQHLDDLAKLAALPPEGLRLVLGYAGWSPGQLMEEFVRNDWISAPLAVDLVFQPDPESAWEAGLRSVGLDPAALAAISDSTDVAN